MTRDSEHLSVMTKFIFVLLLLLQTLMEKVYMSVWKLKQSWGLDFLPFLAMEQDRFITVLEPPSFPDFPTNFSYIVSVGGDREKAHTLY